MDNQCYDNNNPPSNPCQTGCLDLDGWWNNWIGKQRELQAIGILFHDVLVEMDQDGNQPNIQWLNEIIADLPSDVNSCKETTWDDAYTGANLSDVARAMLIKGILSGDAQLINTAKDELEDRALQFGSQVPCNKYHDGIQEDHGFFQHRRILYSSGYGYSFLRSVGMCGAILEAGGVDCPLSNTSILFDALLEGWRWMIRGNTVDYSASGRYIVRDYGNYHTDIPAHTMTWLIDMADGTQYADDLQSWEEPIGNKHFWKSDYVAHHEANYFSSVKMCAFEKGEVYDCDPVDDTTCDANGPFPGQTGCDKRNIRTTGTERKDKYKDNVNGYWLPFGATFIYKDGDEYTTTVGDNIVTIFQNASWNWKKIPGVTAPYVIPDFPTDLGNGKFQYISQNSNFVGAASNGRYSTTVMDLDKNYNCAQQLDQEDCGSNNLTAKKAWFHFGEEIIALGAGISDNSGDEVFTTLNQTWANGGSVSASSANSVVHNGIAYVSPNDAVIQATTADDIFTAHINHGNLQSNSNASYYYIIAPDQVPQTYITNSPIQLIENNTNVQAVKKVDDCGNTVLAGIIYYPNNMPSNIDIGNNILLKTEHPCALLYDGTIGEVCLSSPDRMHDEIKLFVTENGTQNEFEFNWLNSNKEVGESLCLPIFDHDTQGNIKLHCQEQEGVNEVDILPFNIQTQPSGEFSGNPDILNCASLDPRKDVNYMNGISTYDLLLISRHILEIELLDTPYKMIAADVNKSGYISTSDMVELRKLILFIDTELQSVDSWEFVDASHTFQDPANPFAGIGSNPWPFPQTIDASTSNPPYDFTAIKMGDVSCNAEPNEITCPDDDDSAVEILAEDKALTTDEVFVLPLKVKNFNNIAAYQFALDFKANKLQYMGKQSGDLNKGANDDNFGLTEADNGIIRTLWLHNDATDPTFTVMDTNLADSSSLFLLKFKALQDIPALSQVMKLRNDFKAAAWQVDSDECGQKIKLVFTPAIGERSSFLQSQASTCISAKVQPNPTDKELIFVIESDQEREAILQIMDALGRQVLQRTIPLPEGSHRFTIDNIASWQNGLYHFTITDTKGTRTSGRFIKN
ncbi:MAG TPA: T9SS type A sorting domain-containing protein [Gammaproteobacteria bacterium]|nr:T9SS type A sorting domain-containing protein [Gammaproteobacteria bacterium]